MLKKFSIGLSLTKMTKEEYFGIINSFHKNISSIYYSPPFEDFSSRDDLMFAYFRNPNALQDEKAILEYARSKGIKTELAINFEEELDLDYLELVLQESKKFHDPDLIVTYNHYLPICLSVFGESKEYVLTYNQSILSIAELNNINPRFDYIVQGNRWLRSLEFSQRCKELGFKTKLLLNNGCSHNCTWCITPLSLRDHELECSDVLCKNIKTKSVNEQLAVQTILPYELNLIEQYFYHADYKISNRPCYYYELKTMLTSYINREREFNLLFNKSNYFKFIYYKCMTRLVYWEYYYSSCDWDSVWYYKKLIYKNIKLKQLNNSGVNTKNESN